MVVNFWVFIFFLIETCFLGLIKKLFISISGFIRTNYHIILAYFFLLLLNYSFFFGMLLFNPGLLLVLIWFTFFIAHTWGFGIFLLYYPQEIGFNPKLGYLLFFILVFFYFLLLSLGFDCFFINADLRVFLDPCL